MLPDVPFGFRVAVIVNSLSEDFDFERRVPGRAGSGRGRGARTGTWAPTWNGQEKIGGKAAHCGEATMLRHQRGHFAARVAHTGPVRALAAGLSPCTAFAALGIDRGG